MTLSLRENHMEEIRILVIWLKARLVERERDERGFTAVEWLLVALGVIAIAGIAVAAVKSYVTAQTNKLGTP
jgi:Flp pilus assembly pilin Flp